MNYHLFLKNDVGGWDFDPDYVDYIVEKYKDEELQVLISSLGGYVSSALRIADAFKRHGNVHVHFTGMNASAATIAALGAKHVTIDTHALYLIHRCQVTLFEWQQCNVTDLRAKIEELQQQATDLEKLDLTIAGMYAERCKCSVEDLVPVMEKGGWLTAQEALQFGFVDELTESDEDVAPVLTEEVAASMAENDIPLPNIPMQKASKLGKFFAKLAVMFGAEVSAAEPEASAEPEQPAEPSEPEAPAEPEQPAEPEDPNEPAEETAQVFTTPTAHQSEGSWEEAWNTARAYFNHN